MRQFIVPVSILASFVCLGILACAQETPVTQDMIPKAVREALLAKFPDAKIEKCTRAKEGGAVVYDIEFKEGDRKCEADIREDGTYINYEKAIEAGDLPAAVRQAIEQRYPKSTLKEVMEETEVKGAEERLSAYEVVLTTAEHKEVEVRVAPQGKILEQTGAERTKDQK
ncbi:MAG: PepSY-like domain-containing protein [Calditrichaeota bacterium]|nr:PepSY-like domain-containing protein [Calditrichota bacterium]